MAVTGGEPLVQARRLAGVLEPLAVPRHPGDARDQRHPDRGLSAVAPWLTYVSMDLKLPSVDGERVDPSVQRRFLELAVSAGLATWVKIVVGPDTDEGELTSAVDLVAAAAVAAAASPRRGAGPERSADRRSTSSR